MQFCKTCLFQEINPIPISFQSVMVFVQGAYIILKKNNVDWEKRELKFIQLAR